MAGPLRSCWEWALQRYRIDMNQLQDVDNTKAQDFTDSQPEIVIQNETQKVKVNEQSTRSNCDSYKPTGWNGCMGSHKKGVIAVAVYLPFLRVQRGANPPMYKLFNIENNRGQMLV
ncbi:hypothetical protein RJT34_06932 [Clitoria ternatea]|uniref:Uncharacterized protein n=1 Tax=Clitoria ternatea TaxID=43366 RepID=A0AAN9K482_CLITE